MVYLEDPAAVIVHFKSRMPGVVLKVRLPALESGSRCSCRDARTKFCCFSNHQRVRTRECDAKLWLIVRVKELITPRITRYLTRTVKVVKRQTIHFKLCKDATFNGD
nr:hypothetical protein CFP56_37107 [Quercus suber]